MRNQNLYLRAAGIVLESRHLLGINGKHYLVIESIYGGRLPDDSNTVLIVRF